MMSRKIATKIEDLIEAVEKHPVIYSRSISQNNANKNDAWRSISNELGEKNISLLKAKWRNLRDSFHKAIKNKRKFEEMGQMKHYREYVHEDKLIFLLPHIDFEGEICNEKEEHRKRKPRSSTSIK